MKVFFVGTVKFSEEALVKLLQINTNIVGVATKSKSSFNADHVDLSPLCIPRDIPYKYVKDINAPHIIDWIRSLQPDILFVFGWSSLIKKDLLELAPMGVVGFHPAQLPMNRGRHPIIWALALGLKETASTFFFMDEGADSGDLLSQEKIDISEEDDAAALYDKVTQTALGQIGKFVPMLQQNTFSRKVQDNSAANYWRKRGRLDGQIDFRMSSHAIYNLVRALTRPYVGAHLMFGEEEVKIWKVRKVDMAIPHYEPGKVLSVDDDKVLVKSYDGAVEILEHEFKSLPKVNSYL